MPFAAFAGSKTSINAPTLRLIDENGQEIAFLDLAELETLPQLDYSTSTPWTEGLVDFKGPSLKSVLEKFDIDSGAIDAIAVNDYRIQIEVADLTDEAPMVATRRNGERMSVRKKGPLWVVYPYDDDIKFQVEQIYARSIWQLVSIAVVDEVNN